MQDDRGRSRGVAFLVALVLGLGSPACVQKPAGKARSTEKPMESPRKLLPPEPAPDEELISANEAKAVAALRSYAAAQNEFHKADRYGKDDEVYANTQDGNGFADLFELPGGAEPKLIDAAMARASSPASAVNGYWFVDVKVDVAGREYDPVIDHGLCAVPAKHGETGRLTLVIDVTGTLLEKDTGGEPVTSHPGVDGEGWRVAGIE